MRSENRWQRGERLRTLASFAKVSFARADTVGMPRNEPALAGILACYDMALSHQERVLTDAATKEELLSDHYARLAGLYFGLGQQQEARKASEQSEYHRVRACLATREVARWLRDQERPPGEYV